jgi:hypothetical protein
MCLTIVLTASAAWADVSVTIQSDPIGATLYEQIDGVLKMWGYTPFKLKYKTPRRWSGCTSTKPLRVRWISGAEANIESLQLCAQTGKNQQFTFMRPVGVPGVEIDGEMAIAMMKQQNVPAPVYIPPPPPAKTPTTCTPTVIGNMVRTRCY